jgi:hypothetical protein
VAIDSLSPDEFGSIVDQLVTLEGRPLGERQDVLQPLLAAARAAAGGRPVTMAAAAGLLQALQPGDTVFVVSGAGRQPTSPYGESDGPPGAAVVARVLSRGLAAVPVFVCAPNLDGPIVASSDAAGLPVTTSVAQVRERGRGAVIAIAPADQARVAGWAATLFAEMTPKAVISAECLGSGRDGVMYSSSAIPLTGPDSPFWGCLDLSAIFTEANRREIFSVGVGDWGNELGFGTIWEAVARHVDRGEMLAAASTADVVVPATNANWGCYGIEACLAFLLRRVDLMHTPVQEERIVRACIASGGYESLHHSTDFAVDGLEGEAGMAVVQLLGSLLRQKLARVESRMTP